MKNSQSFYKALAFAIAIILTLVVGSNAMASITPIGFPMKTRANGYRGPQDHDKIEQMIRDQCGALQYYSPSQGERLYEMSFGKWVALGAGEYYCIGNGSTRKPAWKPNCCNVIGIEIIQSDSPVSAPPPATTGGSLESVFGSFASSLGSGIGQGLAQSFCGQGGSVSNGLQGYAHPGPQYRQAATQPQPLNLNFTFSNIGNSTSTSAINVGRPATTTTPTTTGTVICAPNPANTQTVFSGVGVYDAAGHQVGVGGENGGVVSTSGTNQSPANGTTRSKVAPAPVAQQTAPSQAQQQAAQTLAAERHTRLQAQQAQQQQVANQQARAAAMQQQLQAQRQRVSQVAQTSRQAAANTAARQQSATTAARGRVAQTRAPQTRVTSGGGRRGR